MTTYESTLSRIGFNPGPTGPYFVSIDVDRLTPLFEGKSTHHFQLLLSPLNGALSLNGSPTTQHDLCVALCGMVEIGSIKVRIVWDEEPSFVPLQEAHFTTPFPPVPPIPDEIRRKIVELNASLAARQNNYVGDPSRYSDGFPKVVTNAPDPPDTVTETLEDFQQRQAELERLKRDAHKQ